MQHADKPSILIVDDDDIIRELLMETLGDSYDLEVADDGYEAIELLKKRSYDLVVTDLKMPIVSGDEVVSFVQTYRPEAQIVVMSAYPDMVDANWSVGNKAIPILKKPFDLHDMILTVENCLEG